MTDDSFMLDPNYSGTAYTDTISYLEDWYPLEGIVDFSVGVGVYCFSFQLRRLSPCPPVRGWA